jgi:transcriptional regulator
MYPFTEKIREKGWTNKEVAKRWEYTARWMSTISRNPKQRDWDALNGLPQKNKD